ncbi:MAG: SAM-dependent methyltransferase, partial [Deltaproteobacteria bacterium]|nr:SAM-dependent methyltransferase [Deltaproteobacteria bacterium]
MRRKVNREEVAKELLPGESRALLQELHLLTRDGDLNADSLRKLKQVNHLIRLLAPALEEVLSRFGDPVIVDCGSGKGYLGFILYELFVGPAGKGTLIGIESRPELARAATERAARLGYERMRFIAGDLAGAPVPSRVHLVTALHACDTATDDALVLAARHGADHVAVVPCCQAEVARQLARRQGADPALAEMHHHPWHRRELGSHLTNVIRALALEVLGYQVTVTELAGWEHSLKNELLLGRKIHGESRPARQRLDALLAASGVRPKLVRDLWGGSPEPAPDPAPDPA